MRWMWVVAAALATAAPASAQEGDALQSYGPLRFGMTIAEARAADPSLIVRAEHGEDLTIMQSPNATMFGNVSIEPILSFRDGRLSRVEFEKSGAVQTLAQCARAFDMVLASLEQRHGAFDGAEAPNEYGTPSPMRTTASGSTVRSYAYDGQHLIHANRRARGWIAFAAHLSRDLRVPPGMQLCLISISIRPQAPPLPPQLTPPSPEELAAARVLSAPTWRMAPDSDTFELTLPAYRPSGRVQVDVDLDCLVIEEGRLNCAVAEERPPGQLYGEFARRLSHAYRIDSRVNGERTIGRRVRVPIEVTLSGPDDAPPGQSQAPNTAGLEALRALAAQAPSRAELDAAPLIQPAQWIERPNAQAFANHYPEDALLRRLEGRVALECLVVAEGRLRCAITEEDPADAGFGLAALGIAQDFRMAAEIDGQPTTGKRVRVALRFNAR